MAVYKSGLLEWTTPYKIYENNMSITELSLVIVHVQRIWLRRQWKKLYQNNLFCITKSTQVRLS
jgi:hypothetical protein